MSRYGVDTAATFGHTPSMTARDHGAPFIHGSPEDEETTVPAPPEGTRLVLVAVAALDQFGTRTDDGRRLTAEWGEPDEHGWYTPTFTATDDGMTIVPAEEIERLREIRGAAQAYLAAFDMPLDADPEVHYDTLTAAREALRAALGEEADHA